MSRRGNGRPWERRSPWRHRRQCWRHASAYIGLIAEPGRRGVGNLPADTDRRYWQELGITYEPHRPSDAESVVTIVRITGGNFRLVERLMNEVARIMTINNLDTITPDPVEAARDVLVVGA